MRKFKVKNIPSSQWLLVAIITIFLAAPAISSAQTVNVDRVVSELEPEIQRMMLAGNIPSCSIALISGDKVIWSNAYGYTNLWARHPQRRIRFI